MEIYFMCDFLVRVGNSNFHVFNYFPVCFLKNWLGNVKIEHTQGILVSCGSVNGEDDMEAGSSWWNLRRGFSRVFKFDELLSLAVFQISKGTLCWSVFCLTLWVSRNELMFQRSHSKSILWYLGKHFGSGVGPFSRRRKEDSFLRRVASR
jgi:hypothetical protein